MESYVIHFHNKETFYEGINELLIRGITFRADFKELTIYLTGGY